MRQNILINNVRSLKVKLYNANYYDFMLHKGGTTAYDWDYLNSIAIADFSTIGIADRRIYSSVLWSGATNGGVELNDIGLTGVDNGFISFRKDEITNKEFLDLYLNSKFEIESGDTRFFMTAVSGNTERFDFPIYLSKDSLGNEYLSMKGGFYQGFFKLDGFDYQVLPDKITDEVTLHFDIRPRTDYEIGETTVNAIHPENKGIFFFMGTRAENKLWPFYKVSSAVTEDMKRDDSGSTSGDCSVYDVWVADEPVEEGAFDFIEGGYFDSSIIGNEASAISQNGTIVVSNDNAKVISLNTYDYNMQYACGCGGGSSSGSSEDEDEDTPSSGGCAEENGKFVETDFIGLDEDIDFSGYTDSDGHEMSKRGYFEIETDNKFVMFDRTKHGVTVDTYVEGMKVILTGRKAWPNLNYFTLLDRTPTGYTVDDLEEYNEQNESEFNIYKDIRNNVFALRITDDGAIGYKMGIFDCDSDGKYKVIEEYSSKGIVKMDRWNSINVTFRPQSYLNDCDSRSTMMRMYIYVNGFLVFISKSIPAFKFSALDEVSEKQEGVPYNISLGGGSLGLLETILPDYYAISEYILPIERDFCGTFLGDIKSFKMYSGHVGYSAIKDYLS